MNAGVAGDELNLAVGKSAFQISTYRSPGGAAIDQDNTSVSCTRDNAEHPWWAVDLDQEYSISHVTITSDSNNRRGNYRRS